MVRYVGSCLRSLAVLVSIAGSAPHSLDGAELAKLQATYQGQLEKLEAPARTLHSSYQRKLEETHAGAMNAGNEALAAAVAAALEEAKEKGIDGFYFVPDDGGEEPEALLRLKTLFVEELAKRTDQLHEKRIALAEAYTGHLQRLEAGLTKAKQLEEAVAVRNERLEVEKQSALWAAALAERSSSPENATKQDPFINGLGMKFVPVPIRGGPTHGDAILFSIWETRVKDFKPFID